MNLKRTHMSQRKLSVRATYSAQQMLAQLQCNYVDWLSEGYEEERVFGTLRARVTPLINSHFGWPPSACRRLAMAWREFEAWREGQRYIRARSADETPRAIQPSPSIVEPVPTDSERDTSDLEAETESERPRSILERLRELLRRE